MSKPDPALEDSTHILPEQDDDGYHKALGGRQIQMIAIGGAIGTGLFLGAGSRLQAAGPSLALVYLICGAFSFLIMRALGELVMYRPTCGSFVSYTREFLGEKAAFVAGWLSFLNWAMTGIVDITAVALYMHFWGTFASVPQWVFALLALCIVTTLNMVGVKWFGEIEFWFSLIKIVAMCLLFIVGSIVLGVRMPVAGHQTGLHLIADNGGLFPHGAIACLLLVQGVVFAYSGIELIGTAAGECADVRTVLPRSINSVIWLIGLFYVLSVVLLVSLLPWTAYHAGTSPFVTFFQALGVPGIDTIMNIVVLTAALSSLNSGLYSTGRVLRAMALGGAAPAPLARMNASSVPANGILLTVAVYLVGVVLNYVVPSQVFEIVLNMAALGIISTWAFILLSQIRLRQAVRSGRIASSGFEMPGAPFTSWLTLAFLGCVVVLMMFDYPNGTSTLAGMPIVALLLMVGWKYLNPARQAAAGENEQPEIPTT